MRGETKPELAFEQHPAPGRLGKRDSKSGDTHVDVIVEDSRTGVRLPPPPSFASKRSVEAKDVALKPSGVSGLF